jgi:pantothenate kinase
MADTIDPALLDKRVVQRFIKKGQLTEKDYERHLKALPDLAEKAAPVEATIEPMRVGTAGSHAEEE